MTQQPNRGKIVIYRAPDGALILPVKVERESVWLTQNQIAELFGVKKAAISKHISNIVNSHELELNQVVSKMETTAADGKNYLVNYYNLDMIISIGYRVNSIFATQFRQWANKVLKEYITKGYAVNEKLRKSQLVELRQLVQIVGRTLQNKALLDDGKSVEDAANEQTALFDVVVDYTYALDTLDNYDYERLSIEKTTTEEQFHATYENAMQTIDSLRQKFGGSTLFGNEKDDSFKSSIGQIYQTFDGKELYPSVEEKAAMLLYLVTKNHSFSDGNKRIAATLFLWFLHNNGILYREDGTKRIADNTLVALTLMIAESRTEEKDTMVKVVVNLINQENE
ncbi:MAG: virulence protein RhuM/Fic/DOC family protein [Paludibacteraceae bacterium]|nr:virulence protein RhuM/Fic/DOC family protein [Paludibacteraceae bacterium]